MTLVLGIDTGGTYTDAVILDEVAGAVVGKAKALTSRPDLSVGVAGAMDAALLAAGASGADIGLVSLSTTLATNALVEGQGGRVALILVGFNPSDLDRAGLQQALGSDPVIYLAGGHGHSGAEVAPLDLTSLDAALADLPGGVTAFAVASQFATRNPAHEVAVRDHLIAATGLPVTCSHDLSQALGGPKRALTALLNARLVGLIARLISATMAHMSAIRIDAPLMVVRGDGALIPASVAQAKPIETILSGPAATLAGAAWLTGEKTALVSDIGGTTTDICLMRDGQPAIDPQGARVGGHRTMVEAVAMRTWGLGGDSEVHVTEGLNGGLRLGPRRVMPMSLFAQSFPDLAHDVLDRALAQETPALDGAQFVLPLWDAQPTGLDPRETAVASRLGSGPARLGHVVTSRIEGPALDRLVSRGLVMISGVTPSDAAHVLGLSSSWDTDAADKALSLFARRRNGAGDRLAPDALALARLIHDQLLQQTAQCLLTSAFAEDGADWDAAVSDHPLVAAGLAGHRGVVNVDLALGVPVIGLGASAASYYPALASRLNTRVVVPEHAEVANAVGAVVGQVRMSASGQITQPSAGRFVVHLPSGPISVAEEDAALSALREALTQDVCARAAAADVAPRVSETLDVKTAEIEGTRMFISADMTVTASGRPRIARSED